jgi:hypothetical protein
MPAAFCCDGHANRYAMAAKSAERSAQSSEILQQEHRIARAGYAESSRFLGPFLFGAVQWPISHLRVR